MEQKYKSFAEFYPFYLSQHSDPVCRGLHYLGSTLVLLILLFSLLSGQFVWLLALGSWLCLWWVMALPGLVTLVLNTISRRPFNTQSIA